MTSQPPGFNPYHPPRWTPPPGPERNVRTIVLLTIAGALLLGVVAAVSAHVAASNEREPVARRATTASPRTTSPKPAFPVDPARNLEKKVGDPVMFGADVVFTITRITTPGRCTEQFAEKPENGHYLFLDVAVTTSPRMADGFSPGVLNALNFSVIGPDGVTETGDSLVTTRTFGCLAHRTSLPPSLGAGQSYQGTIVLDSRNTTGRLVLAPYGLDGFHGWEWNLGEAA